MALTLNELAKRIQALPAKVRTHEALITDGNDENGNAVVFQVENLLPASDLSVNGVQEVSDGEYVILVEDMTPAEEEPDPNVTDDDGFDQFLQDATLALRDMWETRGGDEIGEHEAQTLNDLLTQWFGDKRS